MLFCYKGTKNLKVPILGPQLGIPVNQADPKVCVARCMKAYLDRSAHFDHLKIVCGAALSRRAVATQQCRTRATLFSVGWGGS